MNNNITKIPIFEMDFSKISSKFGYRVHPITGIRSFHYGIDYPDEIGTPVYSIKAGQVYVSKMQDGCGGFGNYVVIKHEEDYSLYAHLHKRLVQEGQTVKQGELIGYVGTTGSSTGSHLHFGICGSYNPKKPNNSTWFDPLLILKSGVVSRKYLVDGKVKKANSILIANQNYVRVADLQDTLNIAEVGYDGIPIIND